MSWRRPFVSLLQIGRARACRDAANGVGSCPTRALASSRQWSQSQNASEQLSRWSSFPQTRILDLGLWGTAAAVLGLGFFSSPSLVSRTQQDDMQQVAAVDPYAIPDTPATLPKSVIVYQYEVCPFCCKLKAFLDYNKIPYQTVEVNPISKSQLRWSAYKKVPVVLLDTEPMADSSVIISHLQAALLQEQQRQHSPPKKGWFDLLGRARSPAEKVNAVEDTEERTWRKWVDDRLVKVLTVNIYRTPRESFQTFDYIADTGKFNLLEREAARIVGATTMYAISGSLKKKYNIEGQPRDALYSTAEEWVSGLGGKPFMGGDKPNLADVSAFGVIRSITLTDTFMDLMHNTSISAWYERMMEAVGESSRIGAS